MVLLRGDGNGNYLLGLHEEGRGHHSQRSHNVPGEQQHQHNCRTNGYDGSIRSSGRPPQRCRSRELRDNIPCSSRGIRPSTGRPRCTGGYGNCLLPSPLIRRSYLDDFDCRAMCQELCRPRSRQVTGSRIHQSRDFPLRTTKRRTLDQDGYCNRGSLPTVPRGTRPHLGIWADVQRTVHRIHDMEVRMEQIQALAG